MGLDNYTTLVYGWLVEGRENVKKFDKDLEEWDEDYFDKVQDVIVDDTMCGEYVYFGAIVARYDAEQDDEHHRIVDDLVENSANKWNKFIKDNPGFKEVIDKYKDSEPKLYLFQNIW